MKTFLLKGFVAGGVLLVFSYLALYLIVTFAPAVAEEYYNPIFDMGGDKTILYFLHPFILSFALAWFWRRFKSLFHGSFWVRGIEMGLVYAVVAVLPSMWITFSALAISLPIVLSWVAYGLFQAVVVGIIYAKISP